MTKIKYISVIIWYTLILWVIFLLLVIFLKHPDNYSLSLRDEGRIIQGSLYIFVAFVCFTMVFLLFKLNRQRHKDVIVQLIGYFGLSAIGVLLQGVFGIIEFDVRDFQTFFTDSSLIFLVGAGFCAGFFVIEVFRKGTDYGSNAKILNLFLGITILSELGLFLLQIIEIPTYILAIPLAGYLLLFLSYFVLLIFGAFDLRKRMETIVEKQAFLFIGMHGILLITVALFAILYSSTDIFSFRYLSAGAAALAFYCLYKGITLPMKKEV